MFTYFAVRRYIQVRLHYYGWRNASLECERRGDEGVHSPKISCRLANLSMNDASGLSYKM